MKVRESVVALWVLVLLGMAVVSGCGLVTVETPHPETALQATQAAIALAQLELELKQTQTALAATQTAISFAATPTATIAAFPSPVISISEPTQTIACTLTALCIFSVKGTSKDVATDSQSIVIFVDPGGANWWPQNLDFRLEIQDNGDWEGKAQIGDKPQRSGTEFRIIALLMNKTQVPTTKIPYKELPASITASDLIPLVVE